MPSPSWPAAIHTPGDRQPATNQRKLVWRRGAKARPAADDVERAAAPAGMPRRGRAFVEAPTRLMRASQPTSSRDEPINSCPVARGWTLNATDSLSSRARCARYPSSTNLMAAKAGVAVGDREVPFARHDRQSGREGRRRCSGSVDHGVGLDRLASTPDTVRQQLNDLHAVSNHRTARSRGIQQAKRCARRINDGVAGHVHAPRLSPGRRFGSAVGQLRGAKALRPHPSGGIGRLLRRARRPAARRPQPARACRSRSNSERLVEPRRQLAPELHRVRGERQLFGRVVHRRRGDPSPPTSCPRRRNALSSTVTRHPSRASAAAHAAPTMPAPTTIASERSRASRRPDTEPERIGRIEAQRRFASDERRAADVRNELAVRAGGQPAGEHGFP